jgi:hypothetical protein
MLISFGPKNAVTSPPTTPVTGAVNATGASSIDPAFHVYGQMQQMQTQMTMLSQLAFNNALVQNQAQNNAGGSGAMRDPMLCFALGEKLGALSKGEELSKDMVSSLTGNLEQTAKTVADLQTQAEVTKSSLKVQSKAHERTIERLDKLGEDLSRIGRDLGELQKSQQYECDLRKTSNESQQRETTALQQKLNETRESLNKTVAVAQSIEADACRDRQQLQQLQKEQRQSLAAIKQEVMEGQERGQ